MHYRNQSASGFCPQLPAMKKILLRALGAIAAAVPFLAFPLTAAGSPAPIALTIPASVHLAITNSHAVKLAELGVTQAALTVQKEQTGYRPSVSMTHEHTQIERSAKPDYGNYIIARLPLIDNGQKKNLIRQSREYYAGAQDALLHTKQQVAAGVMLAYYDALQAGEQAQLRFATRQWLTERLEKLRQVQPWDEHSLWAAERAEAELKQAEHDYRHAVNQQHRTTRSLARLLSLPAEQAVALHETAGQPAISGSLEHMIQSALNHRYDLKQLRKDTRASEWNVKAAVSNTRPTVSWLFVLSDVGMPEQYWYTTVSVTANLFDGNRDRLKIRQANLEAAKSREYLEQKMDEIIFDTEEAYSHFQLATQALERETGAVQQAAAAYTTAGAGYAQNPRTVGGLLNAHKALRTARSELINAGYNLKRCQVSLMRSTGLLPVEDTKPLL